MKLDADYSHHNSTLQKVQTEINLAWRKEQQRKREIENEVADLFSPESVRQYEKEEAAPDG